MQTIEYHTINKSTWGHGKWQDEPDKIQWLDTETGLPCLANRHKSNGHWCGYVGIPLLHPLYGLGYDEPDVHVHGGLTFAGRCIDGPEDEVVCHVVEPGEDDNVWWFGFDCAHGGDVLPGLSASLPEFRIHEWDTYRSLPYVQSVCHDLAVRLKGEGNA